MIFCSVQKKRYTRVQEKYIMHEKAFVLYNSLY